jgi:GTPase SAR1 family protein
VEDIHVHFWDFGGQEIMHATHQFFLSKRSLYILVLDGRRDEKTEYWLKNIESFGGDSPILVVLNKIDENPSFEVNRKYLQEKYKGIKGFYRVSCAEREGIDVITDALSKAMANVELIETMWPKKWFNVKTQLEDMTDNFISIDEYKEMCTEEKITEKTDQDTLVDFLNDLGVILHFKDFELLDTHVLEPKWVTNAVYRIINSKELAACNGVLRLDLLDVILKKEAESDYYYPSGKYRYIIDLMKKFELCYEIDKETVLLPDLLEVPEPEFDFDYVGSLKFVIDYDFLPRSVMPRFIVKMHKDIASGLRWRTGVVLEDKAFHSTAVIKADERDEKIYIYVDGEQKRDYFSAIRKTFRDINDSFEKLEAKEMVPLPDNDEITIEYEELIGYELEGKDEFFIGKLRKGYSVKELLNGIEKEEERRKKIETGPEYKYQVVLSFAGEDRTYAEKLAKLLKERAISVFYDLYEQADLWGKDLYQHLQSVYRDKAQYCVIFLSQAYAQKLWTRHELKQAQARAFREHKEYILPVRIDNTEIPGINETIGYIDLNSTLVEEIAKLLVEKLSA